MKLGLYLTQTICKNQLKRPRDLIISIKTVKTLEEYIKIILHNPGFGKRSLNITARAWAPKEKLDNLDFIEINKVRSSEDTSKRVKRQST